MNTKKIFKLNIVILIVGCFCLLNHPAYAYNPEAVNYNNFGIKYTKKGEYTKAIEYFKKAIQTDTSLNNAYFNLGSVYKHTGNIDKAIKAFQLLLRNTPNDDETAYILAGLYFEKQDYEKALVYVSSIEKTSPFYDNSVDLFKKINDKINDSIVKETPVEPEKNQNTNKNVNKKTSVDSSNNQNIKDVSNVATNVAQEVVSKHIYSNFTGPTGIAEDSRKNLYVADYTSNSILVLTQEGEHLNTIKNELINGPVGLVVDSKDNVYVANYAANNILKIDATGAVSVYLNDIIKPYYLYLNKAGVLFVSEQDKNTIIRLGIPE